MGHLSIAARLVALCAVGVSAIPLRLASYYSPGVVLQRGAPVTIDGWASPGAPVTAALLNAPANASVFASTVASASDGSWAVTFPAQSAGTGWELFATTGADVERCASFAFYCTGPAVSVGNVAFGDVLGCFGQSESRVGALVV